MSVLETLAAFCDRTQLKDLPSAIVDDTKAKIVDSVACGYAGCKHDTAVLAFRLAGRFPAGAATVPFNGQRLTPPDAAFINSAVIHGLLQDDVDLESGHPACTVMPAAFAMAEALGNSGSEMITAIVLGYEAMWRIGGCGTFLMRATARGFRANTILGAFGSAAAAAKLLRLDARGIANALATAASYASGLLEPLNRGTMERCFQQASNSRQGIMAAYLAADGITACMSSIDGPTGLYRACADLKEFPASAMETLGHEYRLPKAFAKPYPSAGSNTVGIAVIELLVHKHKVQPQDIVGITLQVLPRFTGVPGYPSIAFKGPYKTVEQGLISFPFQVACMLKNRSVNLETIRHDLQDTELARLANLVQLVGVDVPHPLWCSAAVTLSNGLRIEATSDDIDWRHFYLDRNAAVDKFMSASANYVDVSRARQFVDSVYALEELSNMSELFGPLRGVTASA